MKHLLIFPMALYVFYIWCIAVFMFRTRVQAIKSGQVTAKYFKAFVGDPPPDRAVLVGRHYDNQFQLPLLFFICGTIHIAMDMVNPMTLILAWVFVISRGFHSWIHLGTNKIQKRAFAFAVGWAVILLMWAQLVYFALK
jgi:hypothetical protein